MRRWLLLLVPAVLSCGGEIGTGTSDVRAVGIEPELALAVGVGDTVRLRARVWDAQDRPISSPTVTWSTDDASVAVVDVNGLATAVSGGLTRVRARSGGITGSATLEVYVPPVVDAWVSGAAYFGRNAYVEYVPGALPVVISVPHGGDLEPGEIPDRAGGTTVTDSWTRETALAVRDAFIERTGSAPHLVISHLKRTKLDPNREIEEAAEGDPFAENAWREFQAFIDTAEAAVVRRYGSGLYLDLHGHGHDILRAELGYLLSADDLARADAVLDAGGYAQRSSIRGLAESGGAPFSELLRGTTSLGGLLVAGGVAAVPSPSAASPGADPYFSGGYNVARHGSLAEGKTVSGVQIELPNAGTRDTDAHRRAFGSMLAAAVETLMQTHWGFFAPSPPPS
jgi:hypothetical protein